MRSRTSRSRWKASSGRGIDFRIPAVRANHEVSRQVTGGAAQEDFAIGGMRVKRAHSRLTQRERKSAQLQGGTQAFSRSLAAQQIQPYFHSARIGVGELFRIFHSRWIVSG